MAFTARRLGQFFGAFLILVSIAIGFHFGLPLLKYEMGSPGYRLEELWQKDLEALQSGGHLPAAWNDIREIQLIPATDDARLWLKDVHTPIQLKASGHHKLEILIVSWQEGAKKGAMLMHHLMELPSENMIFEISRSYELSGHRLID